MLLPAFILVHCEAAIINLQLTFDRMINLTEN